MAKPPRRPVPRAHAAIEKIASRAVVGKPYEARQPELFDLPLPDWIEPCLATLVDKAPSGPLWLHEVKWDGYRVSAYVDQGEVTIRTRNGHDWTHRFPAIAAALIKLPVRNAAIDGEAVVLDDEGRSTFSGLQAELGGRGGRRIADKAALYAFDLMFLDGHDLRPWKLEARREALEMLLGRTSSSLLFSEEVEGEGPAIFEHSCRLGLEGIVSKLRDAPYRSGRRDEWRKTKCVQSDTFYVIGYETNASGLANILVAAGEPGALKPVGGVGTGFKSVTASSLRKQLDLLAIPQSPVPGMKAKGVIWAKPEIRAEVEYRGWTADGSLRHASFKGVREE
jgi:bifunctional non-homologous end joining protein LigD